MAMLEVEKVQSYYGNIHALKNLSLEVDRGEIVSLIGDQSIVLGAQWVCAEHECIAMIMKSIYH